MELERYAGDVVYLGVSVGEFERRLRVVHGQLVLPYVYWAPVTVSRAIGAAAWMKIGPLCDDAEAERHQARLVAAAGPPYLWVWVTREPDGRANVPLSAPWSWLRTPPRALASSTSGCAGLST